MSKKLKIFVVSLGLFFLLLLIISVFFFVGEAPIASNPVFGVTFSQHQAESLGLGWKEVYRSILEDLGVRHLRLIAYWDEIEPKEGEYYFDDLDWQIEQAVVHNAKVILIFGRKLPRWPECYEPSWARNQISNSKNQKLLTFIESVVTHYKNSENIWAWQVENEPFLAFGECPKFDWRFLEEEISLVRSLDSRPIILTDSGEFSLWWEIAKRADIVGSTMYREVYFKEAERFFHYPFPPIFYARKAYLVKKIFGKEVFNSELQAEPWVQNPPFSEENLDEQRKTMNIEKFRENIEFAKKTGFREFYLWGVEWWYWMKEKQNNTDFWEEARKLF